MKVKRLLPSLREKKRYVAFEIISKDRVTAFADVARAVQRSLRFLVGELGAGAAGTQVMDYQAANQRGLVRVSHTSMDALRASFAFITNIENKQVLVRSIGASGILKKAKQYMEA